MEENTVKLALDASALDEAIKKAEKLNSLLREAKELLREIAHVSA